MRWEYKKKLNLFVEWLGEGKQGHVTKIEEGK